MKTLLDSNEASRQRAWMALESLGYTLTVEERGGRQPGLFITITDSAGEFCCAASGGDVMDAWRFMLEEGIPSRSEPFADLLTLEGVR